MTDEELSQKETRDLLATPFSQANSYIITGRKHPVISYHDLMDRLDDTFGVEGWTISYFMLDKKIVVCRLTVADPNSNDKIVRDGTAWRQSDTVDPRETPGSTAFRDACAALGIGRAVARNPVFPMPEETIPAGLKPMMDPDILKKLHDFAGGGEITTEATEPPWMNRLAEKTGEAQPEPPSSLVVTPRILTAREAEEEFALPAGYLTGNAVTEPEDEDEPEHEAPPEYREPDPEPENPAIHDASPAKNEGKKPPSYIFPKEGTPGVYAWIKEVEEYFGIAIMESIRMSCRKRKMSDNPKEWKQKAVDSLCEWAVEKCRGLPNYNGEFDAGNEED